MRYYSASVPAAQLDARELARLQRCWGCQFLA
jgi:hypothetical protein